MYMAVSLTSTYSKHIANTIAKVYLTTNLYNVRHEVKHEVSFSVCLCEPLKTPGSAIWL